MTNTPTRAPDESYTPTPSIKPGDPRTAAMDYWGAEQVVLVSWGDKGAPYWYFKITPDLWEGWKATESPGRYINGPLKEMGIPYERA